MEQVILLLLMGVMVAGGIAAGVAMGRRYGLDGHAARRSAARRELMQLPETPIAAVNNGDRVRITGRALAQDPLRKSPVSQRDCICFRLIIDARHGGDFHRVLDHDEFDSFVITDGTGEAVLQAPFRLLLDPYDARSENVPQAVFDLAKQAGANITMFGLPDQLRYVETILQPGDRIIAVGRATVDGDPAASAPRQVRARCNLTGDDEPVAIADAEVS